MKRQVYRDDGKFLREEEATPKCNKDFCDACGECLVCYGEDPCWPDGEHYWVVDSEEVYDE